MFAPLRASLHQQRSRPTKEFTGVESNICSAFPATSTASSTDRCGLPGAFG